MTKWVYDYRNFDGRLGAEYNDFASSHPKVYYDGGHHQYHLGPGKHDHLFLGYYSVVSRMMGDGRLLTQRSSRDGVRPNTNPPRPITHADIYPWQGQQSRGLLTGHWGRYLYLNAVYRVCFKCRFLNLGDWFPKLKDGWWGMLLQLGAFTDPSDIGGNPNIALTLEKQSGKLRYFLDVRGDSRPSHVKPYEFDTRLYTPYRGAVCDADITFRSTYLPGGWVTALIDGTAVECSGLTSYNNKPVGNATEQHNGAISAGLYTYATPEDGTPIQILWDYLSLELVSRG